MRRPVRSSSRAAAGGGMFVAGVLLLALNLRPGVTAVPPILDEIGAQLGYSSVVLTVATAVPVACFAVFSPVATRLGRRFGDERVLGGAIAAIVLGLAWRGLTPRAGFFPGTVLAGAGIAGMNVLLSSLVKRRAPERTGQLLGAYLALLYLGAILSSAVSVPLVQSNHGDVGLALGIWAAPALAALILWWPQLRQRTAAEPTEKPRLPVPLRRSRLAWYVTAFMGLQSLTYYATLSFLPDIFRSRGLDAATGGLVNTVLSVGGLITAVAAPVVVQRFSVSRPVLVGSAVCCLVGTAGTLVVPLDGALPLMFVLGAGQGVSISLALYFIMARAGSPLVAGALSGMAQGVGYAIATAGPLAIGLLHTVTGSWVVPVTVLTVITAVTFVFGWLAARTEIIAEIHHTRKA